MWYPKSFFKRKSKKSKPFIDINWNEISIEGNSDGENKKWKWQWAKYHSRTIERFWEKFKSEKEMGFYLLLKSLLNSKIIDNFTYEKDKFILVDTIRYGWKTYPKTTYTPDFTVYKNNKIIYIDTKSVITAKKESYRVKVKIFLEKYIINSENIEFMEVISEREFTNYINNI